MKGQQIGCAPLLMILKEDVLRWVHEDVCVPVTKAECVCPCCHRAITRPGVRGTKEVLGWEEREDRRQRWRRERLITKWWGKDKCYYLILWFLFIFTVQYVVAESKSICFWPFLGWLYLTLSQKQIVETHWVQYKERLLSRNSNQNARIAIKNDLHLI